MITFGFVGMASLFAQAARPDSQAYKLGQATGYFLVVLLAVFVLWKVLSAGKKTK